LVARLDGGGDVEELEVEKDALAAGLELGGEVEAAGGEQAEADLVEADVRPQPVDHGPRGRGVGKVEAYDQPCIRHECPLLPVSRGVHGRRAAVKKPGTGT
jgi:hypothetical protein